MLSPRPQAASSWPFPEGGVWHTWRPAAPGPRPSWPWHLSQGYAQGLWGRPSEEPLSTPGLAF